MFNWRIVLSLGIMSVVLSSTIQASVIVDVNISGNTGALTYSYEIENQTSVAILLLSLTVTGGVANIQAPNGWDFSTGHPSPGENLVQWISLDAPFDVPAFGTLAGFVFTSSDSPGIVSFSTRDENFTRFDGQTQGPVVSAAPDAPEPKTVFLDSLIIAIIIIASKRVRAAVHRAATSY